MTDTVVWIATRGGKFHRVEDCHPLKHADVVHKTTLSDAESRGYVECMRCGAAEIEHDYSSEGCWSCERDAISAEVPYCHDCISTVDRYDPCADY